jgi:hypothetical protein
MDSAHPVVSTRTPDPTSPLLLTTERLAIRFADDNDVEKTILRALRGRRRTPEDLVSTHELGRRYFGRLFDEVKDDPLERAIVQQMLLGNDDGSDTGHLPGMRSGNRRDGRNSYESNDCVLAAVTQC